jgi:2-polyprenyl-6-methoxyphenol hydroxylase-like FAD-dependent oxidoreductase
MKLPEKPIFDVLIVGSGPVGLATGLAHQKFPANNTFSR